MTTVFLVGSLAVLALALFVIVLARRYTIATVRGHSMQPTLYAGDQVLVRRRGKITSGDVIVVRSPFGAGAPHPRDIPQTGWKSVVVPVTDQWLIKRVAAVPGEPVPRERFPALHDVPEDVVPPGALVLLGDNPSASHDSRTHGYFAHDQVLGIVLRQIRRASADTPQQGETGSWRYVSEQ